MTAILSVILCLALVGADQFIKYLVVEYLKPIEYVDVVEGFLRFRYVENTGAVFGSFATHTVLLTIFSCYGQCFVRDVACFNYSLWYPLA